MVLLLYSMYTVHCKVDADAVYSDAEGNVTTVFYTCIYCTVLSSKIHKLILLRDIESRKSNAFYQANCCFWS